MDIDSARVIVYRVSLAKKRSIIEILILLRITVLGVEDCEVIDKDILRASIKSTSIDYTIN